MFRKCLPSSSSLHLRIETYSPTEMLVPFYQKVRCHIPTDIITVKALRTSVQEFFFFIISHFSHALQCYYLSHFFAAPFKNPHAFTLIEWLK